MKSSRFPIFLIAVLLGLLTLLATLQYRWLGQISDGERERLQRVVQSDTERFAEDFNREIQNAYFNFQLNADDWRNKNWAEFNERYKFYAEKTAYPNLIKNFYFVKLGESETILRYNRENKTFEASDWTETLAKLKPKIADNKNFQPIADEVPALLLPIHDTESKFTQIFIRTEKRETGKENSEAAPPIYLPEKYGVLIIELDENVIKDQIFPGLVEKYFSENENANFRLAVTDNQSQTVFKTSDINSTDASAKLFDLSTNNFVFFANRNLLPKSDGEPKERKTMVFSRVESRIFNQNKQPEKRRVEVQASNNDSPRVRIFDGENSDQNGVWTLNVQHTAGSLEQFITDTRRKNLAISFSILFLLGVSVTLIFISAQRAKLFAQRQVDFVSSVSHEFRTPLAVIYSAGENLADGVAKEETQVSRYGNLIKGEGRKISKMVEQILDFAGANSGKKKYDFREIKVKEIIEDALAECRSLLDEKEFKVEKNIAENLPKILADKTAISQTIQNLIVNSVKYSNGEKHLKISANNGGGKIKITVEDNGIGIAPKDLTHIFEPFYRSKVVVDEQIHGNGLGLSLVKQTVERHGGKVSVESAIGDGSRFTIELPIRKLSEPEGI